MNKVFLYLFFTFTVFLFWLLFANFEGLEQYEFFSIISIAVTVTISFYLDLVPKKYFGIKSFKYLFWLSKEIIVSSYYVCRTIWSPKLDLDGEFINFQCKIHSEYLKVLYANSIALTPGTYTINIEGDKYLVHAFSSNTKNDLLSRNMESNIYKLEEPKLEEPKN